MTISELFSLMVKCNHPQLDAIVRLVGLDQRYLNPNESIVTRANGIIQLAEQNPQRLAKLEEVVLDMFPAAGGGGGGGGRGAGGGGDVRPPQKQKSILILAANPIETDRLMLDEEVRIIKQRLDESDPGRQYRIESEWAVRPTELAKFLLKYEPTVVHFSGHGSPTGELILQNDDGQAAPVPVNILANLFEILKGPTECIVLNACYSAAQAKMLANYVSCVVGMSKSVGDPSALRFAGGFYRGIAFGRDYLTAFRLGSNEIELGALPDAAVPHFTTRSEDQVATASAEKRGADGVALVAQERTWTAADRGARAANGDGDAPKLYPVWFGTNRRPVDAADLSKGFSAGREQAGVVYRGLCKVAVPKSHKFGSVGSAWWKRLLTLTDDRLKLKEISILEEAAFWEAARQALAQWPAQDRMALVFIHGFNVSFEEAAIRAAQMGTDLKITGETAFFSWPSQGKLSLRDYTADEDSIMASEQQITDFLVGFSEKTDAQRVHVIAHSMGNRGLLRAMRNILQKAAQQAQKPFRNVIFAAPDVDAEVFRQLAPAFKGIAARATLYVSSRDRALASSGILHKDPRAGFTPPVTLVDGIDTIDVANADLTLLGHGYYGAAEGVLYDMHELVAHDTPVEKRLKLQRPPNDDTYWRISQ